MQRLVYSGIIMEAMRENWTDDRMHDIARHVDTGFTQVHEDLAALRAETHQDIAGLRADHKEDIAGLRADLGQDAASTRYRGR
jgi:hypothetical protein